MKKILMCVALAGGLFGGVTSAFADCITYGDGYCGGDANYNRCMACCVGICQIADSINAVRDCSGCESGADEAEMYSSAPSTSTTASPLMCSAPVRRSL